MAKFINITPLYGHATSVNVELCLYIRDVTTDEYGFKDGARGQVNLLGSQGGETFIVRETRAEILAAIASATSKNPGATS